MTASVNTDIDYSKLKDLRKRLPELSDMDLTPPQMEDVGRRAGQAVDRLLGRERRRPWPQIAAAIGVVAVIGLVMAWLTWGRRSPWNGQPSEDSGFDLPGSVAGPDGETLAREMTWDPDGSGAGLTAAEASLTTTGEAGDRA